MKIPLGHRPDKCVNKVSELLLPDGEGWDEEKLNETFFGGDVEDIKKIPIGCVGSVDYVAWNYTKNGISSVRSAYHLAGQLKRERMGLPSSSSSFDNHKGWLAIWAADVPNKTKIHF
jgi:hypothetical protein